MTQPQRQLLLRLASNPSDTFCCDGETRVARSLRAIGLVTFEYTTRGAGLHAYLTPAGRLEAAHLVKETKP